MLQVQLLGNCEKDGFTQSELAERLNVSDKTVSKWETGKGYPDITLLEPIAKIFRISVNDRRELERTADKLFGFAYARPYTKPILNDFV